MECKTWVQIRAIISRIAIPFLLLPSVIWSYYYTYKEEQYWFRISFFGEWQEEVGSFFNIVAEGKYANYPIGIFLMIIIGITFALISWVLVSIKGGKLLGEENNPKLIRRLFALLLLASSTVGFIGVIRFYSFVDSIRVIALGDFTFSFYIATIILLLGIVIGLATVIFPGSWVESSEEAVEDPSEEIKEELL